MAKRLGSAELPLLCQRRFEPSRLEPELWSEAYQQLVPESRRPQAGGDSAIPCCRKQAHAGSLGSYSLEGHCA